ncbi:MAG: hypothetical protein QM605_11910 [Sphingobium sp.]
MTQTQTLKIEAEIANLIAATAKINAETDKIRLEKALYPLVAGSGFTLAIVGLAKLFL